MATWLTQAPVESEMLRLTAKRPMGGDQVLVELSVADLRDRTPMDYAEYLTGQCEEWADTLNRECTFLLQWFAAGERPIATLQFRCGPFDASAMPVDGSPESFLLQMQATILQKDKLLLDMVRTSGESYRAIIELLTERLVTLERDRSNVESQRFEVARAEADLSGEAADNEKFKQLVGLAERLITAGAKASKGSGENFE